MSAFYDLADQVAAVLEADPALADVRVVVDRQKDIAAEVRKTLGKQTGNLALVTWAGGKNTDETSDGPLIESRLTVTLFSKPVLSTGGTAADDLLEAIGKALHDNRLDGSLSYNFRLILEGIDPVADGELLVFRVNLRASTQL